MIVSRPSSSKILLLLMLLNDDLLMDDAVGCCFIIDVEVVEMDGRTALRNIFR